MDISPEITKSYTTPEALTEHLLDIFKFSPTPHQYKAFHYFAQYYLGKRMRSVFLLKGSAGTGKTSILSSLTHFFTKSGNTVVLMAPTGRAAKVISRKTRRSAQTLHRHIYRAEKTNTGIYYHRAPNEDAKGTVYIIDEASMIGDEGTGNALLRDTLDFILDTFPEAVIIFTGDEAQLPPVGTEFSPALNAEYLEKNYLLHITEVQMSDVKRQALDSGILLNANKIRRVLSFPEPSIRFYINHEDVRIIENRSEALEEFSSRFDQNRQDKMVLITYSNYWAGLFNKAYRAQVYDDISLPQVNDRIMVVKNNYAWAKPELPFLANGETGVIRKIYAHTEEQRYGLKWIDADIEFESIQGEPVEIYVKLVLDLLDTPDASIPYETMQKVMRSRKKDVVKEKSEGTEYKKDPYVHALQVKYAYAITAHKAQGGQWEDVIVAFEPLYPQMTLKEYYRWVYTAVTRAEKQLFLLNCPFLEEDKDEMVICYRNDFTFQPALIEDVSVFTEAESTYLRQYGEGLIHLLNGVFPANTEERKQLIRVINAEEKPMDLKSTSLLKYIEYLESKAG